MQSSFATLSGYLKSLPAALLQELYEHQATCIAVFRELSPLAQQIVMRMLFVEQAVPKAVVKSWVTAQQNKGSERAAETALSDLGVWTEECVQGAMQAWTLVESFKRNLKTSILGGGQPWTIMAMKDPDPNKRDIAFLDQYAKERWDTVLHYMVGSSQQEGVSADAVKILLNSELMVVSEGESSPSITRSGFQFLLMDTPSQVWFFILQYLNTVQARNMDLGECLNFLFQLSFAELGKDYSTAGISVGILTFLQHLREFGLVYQRKRTSGRFYPTRLALNIASGESKSLTERHREGYLVVETNFRVYAYTTSNLKVALIGLFAEMVYRFPNLAVAVITRDSIREALRGGIAASQIVRFLRLHAHPQQQEGARRKRKADHAESASEQALAHDKLLIPPTVIDQIYLWEKERDRFSFRDGVLYNQFLSHADFDTVRNYANSLGVCVWANDKNRTVVVTREGHDAVKKFWRQHSKGGSGLK